MIPDHCNGCGKPGRLITAPADSGKFLLLPVPDNIFPDDRRRYFCPKCTKALKRRRKRLLDANHGW
jgi:hypothetical protein